MIELNTKFEIKIVERIFYKWRGYMIKMKRARERNRRKILQQ